MKRISRKRFLELDIEPPKSAAQLKADVVRKAKALPLETRQKFWHLMMEEHKTLGQARELCGIDDVMVAAELVILCHEKIEYYRPLTPTEIK